jgi:hypothetical protein
VDFFLNRTGAFLSRRPDPENLSDAQRQDLANLFLAYGKDLLKVQRSETGEMIASGGISIGSVVVAIVDGTVAGGVGAATIGVAVWLKNGQNWLKWHSRVRELEFFDDWISSLVGLP